MVIAIDGTVRGGWRSLQVLWGSVLLSPRAASLEDRWIDG